MYSWVAPSGCGLLEGEAAPHLAVLAGPGLGEGLGNHQEIGGLVRSGGSCGYEPDVARPVGLALGRRPEAEEGHGGISVV